MLSTLVYVYFFQLLLLVLMNKRMLLMHCCLSYLPVDLLGIVIQSVKTGKRVAIVKLHCL